MVKGTMGFILFILFLTGPVGAQETQKPLTLDESIRIALERNLALHSAKEGVLGSEFRRKAARADFLPKWTGQYGYTRYESPVTVGSTTSTSVQKNGTTITIPPETTQNYYSLSSTLAQTLFAGGAITSTYRFEKIGLELSKTNVEVVKRDIVLNARVGYFNIIIAEKFVDVARQAVKQFDSQMEVSRAFFDVGLIPKNDVLQAEVRLANAKQALVKAENDLALAKSSFNNLLRQEINTPIEVVDILSYKAFPLKFEESVEEALQQRPEMKAAGLTIEQAKENVKIVRSGLFPTVTLSGNYARNSDEFYLNGDLKSDRWYINALATMTLWEWGKTYYKVGESKTKVTQAEDSKVQLREGIILEVKDDYLNMTVAERNIAVSEKAIEQAEENLRLNEERYKYQVSTATDVLDAVALLAQARGNYYSALGDFNIAKAKLERSMGRMPY